MIALNDKKKTNQHCNASSSDVKNHSESNFQPPHPDNSASGQRLKIITHLQSHNSLTTAQGREMGIMSPASRVIELRKAGWQIATVWVDWVCELGIKHPRVAKYVLMASPQASGGVANG